MPAIRLPNLGKPALAGLLAVAWIMASPTLVAPALAQDKVESSATIETIAYQPIPPGARLLTQPETQSQMDDDAWRQVDADLGARGYAVGGDSDLVVTVATQLVSRLSADRSVSDVNAAKSDPKNAHLFSTEGGTLLNPQDPINTTDRVFRINMTVYDRPSGHFVWRGTVERSDAALDAATAMREMLPALLDHFGETATGVTIPLSE
ncbi:MAG: hypothetical protein IPK59_11525 [Rhodospirillaceae bacterium]|nr:hypothetical protein [Rhodospirillaceae bacterium]